MAKRSAYGIIQKKLNRNQNGLLLESLKIPDQKINTKNKTGNDIGARENEE